MPQRRSGRQLRRREVGWEAAGSELSVRRMTNSIRRDVLASPQRVKPENHRTRCRGGQSDVRTHHVVGGGTTGR